MWSQLAREQTDPQTRPDLLQHFQAGSGISRLVADRARTLASAREMATRTRFRSIYSTVCKVKYEYRPNEKCTKQWEHGWSVRKNMISINGFENETLEDGTGLCVLWLLLFYFVLMNIPKSVGLPGCLHVFCNCNKVRITFFCPSFPCVLLILCVFFWCKQCVVFPVVGDLFFDIIITRRSSKTSC